MRTIHYSVKSGYHWLEYTEDFLGNKLEIPNWVLQIYLPSELDEKIRKFGYGRDKVYALPHDGLVASHHDEFNPIYSKELWRYCQDRPHIKAYIDREVERKRSPCPTKEDECECRYTKQGEKRFLF